MEMKTWKNTLQQDAEICHYGTLWVMTPCSLVDVYQYFGEQKWEVVLFDFVNARATGC
jgi:hypothetical protein